MSSCPPSLPSRQSPDMKRLSVFLCVNIGNNSHFRRCSLFSVHTPQINQIRVFLSVWNYVLFLLPLSLLTLFFPILLLLIKFPRLAPVIFHPGKSILRWILSYFLFLCALDTIIAGTGGQEPRQGLGMWRVMSSARQGVSQIFPAYFSPRAGQEGAQPAAGFANRRWRTPCPKACLYQGSTLCSTQG